MSDDQNLPPTQANQFKSIVRHFEAKQYKKTLKLCDGILKKFPTNGETLAMKGLTLYSMGKKDGAEELIREGVARNVMSSTAWHVLGIYLRHEKKYGEAMPALAMASRQDAENLSIMHELSTIQVQQRNYDGFIDTRNKILAQKSNLAQNWTALAVGYHMSGEHEMASTVITTYLSTKKDAGNSNADAEAKFQVSELLLYRSQIMAENGDTENALARLVESESQIVDRDSFLTQKGAYETALGDLAAAESTYRELLASNIDNVTVHYALLGSLGIPTEDPMSLDDAQRAAVQELYAELREAHPRATLCKTLPIKLAGGDVALFEELVTPLMHRLIRKGTPSAYAIVSGVCSGEAELLSVVTKVATAMIAGVRAHGKWAAEAEDEEPPSSLLWALYFLAQHQHLGMGESQEALATLEEAVAHTPTVIDLYMLRAQIYGDNGNAREAAYWNDYARQMDLADRFINSECTKRMLRADLIPEAAGTIRLFTKDTEIYNTIHDMQCLWYEIERGQAHARLEQWGRALKMFSFVDHHFNTMVLDQYDFHPYCFRKGTLSQYVRMLHATDNIRTHEAFFQAATGAVAIYIGLHKQGIAQAAADEAELEGLDESARKKAISKRNRTRKRMEEEREKERLAQVAARKAKSKSRRNKTVDNDPNGDDLAATKTPLDDATPYIQRLLEAWPTRPGTHIAAANLYTLKGKPILALRAAVQLARIAPNLPAAHKAIVGVCDAARNGTLLDAQPEIVAQTVRDTLDGPLLLAGQSLEAYANAFLDTHGATSLAALVAGLETAQVAPASAVARVLAHVAQQDAVVSRQGALDAWHALCGLWSADDNALDAFKQDVAPRFPFVPEFGGACASTHWVYEDEAELIIADCE